MTVRELIQIDACKWCKMGNPVDPFLPKYCHVVLNEESCCFEVFRCTAPTDDSIIDTLFNYYDTVQAAAGFGYPASGLSDVEPNAREISALLLQVRTSLEWALESINMKPFEWGSQEDADSHRDAIRLLEFLKKATPPCLTT